MAILGIVRNAATIDTTVATFVISRATWHLCALRNRTILVVVIDRRTEREEFVTTDGDAFHHNYNHCVSINYKHCLIRLRIPSYVSVLDLQYQRTVTTALDRTGIMIVALLLVALCVFVWHKYFNSTLAKGECSVCGHRGHRPSVCYHRNRTCGVCLQKGHISSVCTTILVAENSAVNPWYLLYFILTWCLYIFENKRNPEYRCRACGQADHTSRSCRYSIRRCNQCRVKGHIASACPGYRCFRRIRNYFYVVLFLIAFTFLIAKYKSIIEVNA